MSILLGTSWHLPDGAAYDTWLSPGTAAPLLDPFRRVADVPERLEAAYDVALKEWRRLAPRLAAMPGADYAHTPACAPNASDFGEMLAWLRVVEELACESRRTLVVCDDPWLFRRLSRLPGVSRATTAPHLWPVAAKLSVRGMLARIRVALRAGAAVRALQSQHQNFPKGAAVILVYAHPRSTASGHDGYFGDLMSAMPGLVRLLHVDCAPHRARELAGFGRSFSLHAWGSTRAAFGLPFHFWRGPAESLLLRRALARESASGQPAMIRWQHICQRRWLDDARPRVVAWPWENHAWERAFVRDCRARAVSTIGYQHATVGRHEANYAVDGNSDGLDSIPDVIVTSGPAGYKALRALGYPEGRLRVGGAFRYTAARPVPFDPNAPVCMALPFDARVAREMVTAAQAIARGGRQVIVRDHPMTPFHVSPTLNLRRAEEPFDQLGPLSAVVYAGTTVGLEARLAGLPTFRFMPSGCVPNDIIPPDIDVGVVTAENLEQALSALSPPSRIDPARVFSPPDLDLWRTLLGGGITTKAA